MTTHKVIHIKMDPDPKEAFEELCKANGMTVSAVLRIFMEEAVKSSKTGKPMNLPVFHRPVMEVTYLFQQEKP